MSTELVEHDTWNYSPPKLPKASVVRLNHIHGVLPFDGVRNPGFRSSTSHRIWLPYQTAANDWQPKVGICESAAEAAVAIDALISPQTYDVKFQPFSVAFEYEGKQREYTHDLLITHRSGRRDLVFVRNGTSLSKPKTRREIEAIIRATPPQAADNLLIVSSDDYSRQRRENLFRMHQFLQEEDVEAENHVLSIAKASKSLWQMKDIIRSSQIPKPRAFRACYRLIARKKLIANLDHVILETSRVQVAA
ncbi:hypothetical protein [Thioclava sp.]|uniref:hypothetical protein n=1 Tax=Thioclava sp. TaxID=1933450 RepID=UPI003AA898E5